MLLTVPAPHSAPSIVRRWLCLLTPSKGGMLSGVWCRKYGSELRWARGNPNREALPVSLDEADALDDGTTGLWNTFCEVPPAGRPNEKLGRRCCGTEKDRRLCESRSGDLLRCRLGGPASTLRGVRRTVRRPARGVLRPFCSAQICITVPSS